MKFNNQIRSLILAMVWGDGYVSKQGDIIVKHSIKQADYVLWKYNLLKKAHLKLSPLVQRNNGKNNCLYFRIHVTKYGKRLRRVLYQNSFKNIYRRKWLNKLTPFHLALWYMDDGSLSQKKENGKIVGNEVILHTYTTKENNQVVIDYFKEEWDISFSQVKSKGRYRLRCGTREARKFIKIVEFYVRQVPSMSYKLNVKPEPKRLRTLQA